MALFVVGISHRTAPLEVRERFAMPPGAEEPSLARLASEEGMEAVVLSTCNRTELYLSAREDAVNAPALGRRLLVDHAGMGENEGEPYLYTLRGRSAVRHLFRVVSSLDSMIVGEAQIQGQVKEAYGRAIETGGRPLTVGPVLSRLFESALRVGAHVRRETHLGEGAASIPSAAVSAARSELGSLEGKKALVLGAGEMSGLMLRCLRAEGVHGISVTNRTEARAQDIAARMGVASAGLDGLQPLLAGADVVATATAAPHVVLTRDVVARAMHGRDRLLVLLDIALPRDVDPAVRDLDHVRLYDLDDLSRVVDGTLERRSSAIEGAERIIEEGEAEFWGWYRGRSVVPVIRELRGRAEELRQRELRRARGQLRNLSEPEFDAVDRLTRRLLAKILHIPTSRLRDAAAQGGETPLLDTARYLFSLDEGAGQE